LRMPTLAAVFGELKHIFAKQLFCIKKAPQGWEAGEGFAFAGASVGLVLNFDGQFRRLDIDGFNRLTDDTSDGIEHLRCSLQLPLLQSLMEELGPHVLQTSEHIFAIIFPVFINELFYGCPIAPSSFD